MFASVMVVVVVVEVVVFVPVLLTLVESVAPVEVVGAVEMAVCIYICSSSCYRKIESKYFQLWDHIVLLVVVGRYFQSNGNRYGCAVFTVVGIVYIVC